MCRLLVAGWVLVVPVGFAPSAPVPEGAKRPPLYFPVTPKARWVYELADGQLEAVVGAGVEKVDNGGVIVARAGADGNLRQYAKMVVSAAGLRRQQVGQTQPAWLLKTPFRSGEGWDIPDGAGGGKRTVYGPEPVEVPAGKFVAARVVWDRSGGRRLTSWYAPGVGEVKRVEREADGTETVTRSLKSFTPGKD